MLCSYHCTAKSYNLKLIDKTLNVTKFNTKFHEDVVCITIGDETNAFIFSYGVFVIWNAMPDSLDIMREICDKISIDIVDTQASDIFEFVYSDKTEIDDVLIKLSLSYALSQSVKLEVFESSVAETIQETSFLTKQVSARGKTTLSRRKVSKLMGELFEERNSINLDCDLLDTPEFFWKRPGYEPYYKITTEYLDLKQRIDVLHRRLDVVHELYIFLSHELNSAHSSFLEWIIIILISVEIAMEVVKQIKDIV